MTRPALSGIHHVKLPAADVGRLRDWYERVFGLRVTMQFADDDGVVRGVVGEIPGLGDATVAIRENPTAAAGCQGFDPVSFAVDGHPDILAWAAHLDALGIEHSPVIEASVGWLLKFVDAEGLEVHLYTWAAHGIDRTAEAGYGQAVSG